MLRRTLLRRAFVTAMPIGSKGQKHMYFAPVKFLYRYPGNYKNPGPVLMKYWWTLGMFPTGLTAPFRFQEFVDNYKALHMPDDVERWLESFLVQPATALAPNAREFAKRLEALPVATPTLHKRANVVGVPRAAEPLQLAMRELGLEVPTVAVRAVAERPALRRRLVTSVAEYGDTVAESGSTPHRRWAARELAEKEEGTQALLDATAEQPTLLSQHDAHPDSDTSPDKGITEAAASAVHAANELPTQPDEALLVETLTTLAVGCDRMQRHAAAEALLQAALGFAHDDELAAEVHSNLASACNKNGHFGEAVAHGQAAALRARSAKGFANWAVATAYLDDVDGAAEICQRGLAEHPESAVLKSVETTLARHMTGRVATAPAARGKRYHAPAQTQRGLLEAQGEHFMNETDIVMRTDGVPGVLRECFRVDTLSGTTRTNAPYSARLPHLGMDNYNGFDTK